MSLLTHSVLTVYPMDTIELSKDEDGLPIYDRPYNAADLRGVISRMVTDGVFPDYLDEMRPVSRGGSWYVTSGGAVASGLYIPLDEELKVADQADIPFGQYLYIVCAARFDINNRDGAIYGRLSSNSSETPVRTESVHELILARVDWRGTMTDYRADAARCGIVSAVNTIDADSYMAELHTAVSQFNLNVGSVVTLPPGTTPEVTVRKPEVAGGEVFIDFGIPRGPQGEKGQDGSREPALWIRPESDPPTMHPDDVWLVDDKTTHVIGAIKAAEVDKIYPAAITYPANDLYPGGSMQWVDHTIATDLVQQ